MVDVSHFRKSKDKGSIAYPYLHISFSVATLQKRQHCLPIPAHIIFSCHIAKKRQHCLPIPAHIIFSCHIAKICPFLSDPFCIHLLLLVYHLKKTQMQTLIRLVQAKNLIFPISKKWIT